MDDTAARGELSDAIARHRQGDVHAALAVYDRVLAGDPGNMAALRHQGLARFQLGQRKQGIACLRRVVEASSADAVAWSDLGRMQAVVGDLREALASFRQSVTADPGYADGWHNLGTALRRTGDTDGALHAYKRALACDPDRADTYLNIGNLLVDDNQTENAIESFRRAAQLDPGLAQARERLAGELSGRGDVPEAEFVYRQAVALNPRHAQAWFGLGRTLEDLGQAEEAARCYRQVLALHPGQPWALGQLLGMDGADAALMAAARQALADQMTPDGARALIGYGVAKAMDRRGEYDDAFAALAQANAARRRVAGPFDAAAFEDRVARLIDTFTPEFFAERRGFGIGTDQPVFIVGMPRSGTTLTEQVLDRHPRAFGAGEVPHLAELAVAVGRRRSLPDPWPLSAPALCRNDVHEAAHEYLRQLTARAPQRCLRVSDKSPLNFYHLGFVALLFPNARIVHCRRDPIDTCLSIYFENFRANQTYATDLADIAACYRGYQRLMDHWQRVLPLRTLEVRYEDMVADLDGRARALVDFMGLRWDPRCLEFHASGRAVQTPSRWQVRKPIYASSVGRWRRYDRHLAVLKEAFPEAAAG